MDLIEAKDNQEEVNVEVRNDRLTISGNKKPETNEGRFAVRERPFGRFARTLQLPEGTKPEQVQAHMEKGLLEVTFPKAPPQQQTKFISIEELLPKEEK
ncbi:HSP20-like chaperone, partial [Suillus cothurnatus]